MKRVKIGRAALPVIMGMLGCAVEGAEETGAVRAEITSVPAGVQCLRLAVRIGAATNATNRNFAVTAGQSTTLDLGVIAAGALTVTPSAYTQACGSVAAATVAAWVGEAVTTTVRAGEATTLALTLRPNVSTSATVDFVLPARAVVANAYSMYAVMADGTVRRWGQGTAAVGAVETLAGLTEVVQLAPRPGGGCALRRDGTAWCWGTNTSGQLGIGITGQPALNTPRPVVMPAGVTFRAIAASFNRICALATSGTSPVYCWGLSEGPGGTLGSQTAPYAPVYAPTAYGVGSGFTHDTLALGRDTLCLGRGATLYCYGANTNNWWGSPVNQSSFGPSRSLSFGSGYLCGVFANGITRCAGANTVGQLGNDTTVASPYPVNVAGLDGEATRVSAGLNHTCAVRIDGRAFCWGDGTAGQLGDRDAGNRYRAVEVRGLTDVVDVAAGYQATCAVKSDGTVWCWGDGSQGELADGARGASLIPVRVNL